MLVCVSTCGHADMCWYVPTCADMCQHVKPLSTPLISTSWNLSCMLAYVSTFGHADTCWYVPTCADICRHANMCNHSQNLWYKPFETYLACWHMSANWDMPIYPDIHRHVLACANMFRHITSMCRHVPASANMWNHSQHLWYQPFETYFAC